MKFELIMYKSLVMIFLMFAIIAIAGIVAGKYFHIVTLLICLLLAKLADMAYLEIKSHKNHSR